jgi:hypothetical protein
VEETIEGAWRSAWSLCIDCRRVPLGRQPCGRLLVERSGILPQRADVEVDGATVRFEQPADFVPLLGGGKSSDKRQARRGRRGWDGDVDGEKPRAI